VVRNRLMHWAYVHCLKITEVRRISLKDTNRSGIDVVGSRSVPFYICEVLPSDY
jgi:hypothetical protein